MSSSSSSASSKRPLKELLHEHQQPFELEDYLLERGYPIKALKLQGSSFGCCSTTSTTNFLTKSATKGNKHGKRQKNIATSLHKKLVASINQALRFNDPGTGSEEDCTDAEKPRNEEEEESGEFLRGSSATELDIEYSYSESDVETTSIRSTYTALRQYNSDFNESFSERMNQWRITEESKQTSPVSVLDEIEALSEYHPVYNVKQNSASTTTAHSASTTTAQQQFYLHKVTEDSIFSASLWEQLLQQRKKTQCGNSINAPIDSKSLCHPQFINSKKALQQTRQLLFDYVREVVETNGINQTRHLGEPKFLGPEEIGKIICDNIKAWGKQSVNERKVTRLLKSELIGEVEWWNDDGFESYRKEIMMEIGDRIFEDVQVEIVQDMTTLLCSN